MLSGKRIVFLLMLGCSLALPAQTKKPCLIFSGNAGENYAIDLERYNRIHFGENSMTLENSEKPGETLEVLYEAYHRFMVDEAEVTVAVDEIAEAASPLTYNPSQHSLSIPGNINESYKVGVCDMSGTLLLTGTICGNDFISVESLGSGIYVAVAVSDKSNKSLKFVKK